MLKRSQKLVNHPGFRGMTMKHGRSEGYRLFAIIRQLTSDANISDTKIHALGIAVLGQHLKLCNRLSVGRQGGDF
ncbi:MAG: hypothetical protein DWI22_22535 [Planctomycetota bacterium]|nr:MAG: hypothetical protein DWI22_22535 [Planctomycetota bacterium]